MKFSLVSFIALSALLLFLEGCTLRPLPLEQPPRVSVIEWLPALREHSEHWNAYQARAHIRAQTPDKKINMSAVILARLPGQFRLEAFRLGQTVGLLTMNHGESSLLVPSERILYTAERSEVLIDRLFGISLPLGAFGYTLCASLPPDQLESLQIFRRGANLIGLPNTSPDGWSYEWQFFSLPQAIESARVKQGNWNYTIHYEPPVGLAVQDVPKKITFSSTQWQIEVSIQEITTARNVQDSVFHIDAGGETLRVKLTPELSD
jgi:hypothetical protein